MTSTLANGPFTRSAMTSRVRACLVHLAISAVVAVLCALLVFGLWYPTPFREISGGRDLFVLVVTVDVVLGPVITFFIFDRRKPQAELRRDLVVVAALQLAGLVYGLHSVHLARPVVLALETDRLRVVRAIDLDAVDLSSAPAELRSLPWEGIVPVATRPPTASERQDVIDQGLAGRDIGARPEFWLPPKETSTALARAAKPISGLTARQPQQWQTWLENTGLPPERLGYLPMLGRTTSWSALIDLQDGSIVGYLPVDGF